jgi:hypothetical protein
MEVLAAAAGQNAPRRDARMSPRDQSPKISFFKADTVLL